MAKPILLADYIATRVKMGYVAEGKEGKGYWLSKYTVYFPFAHSDPVSNFPHPVMCLRGQTSVPQGTDLSQPSFNLWLPFEFGQ